MSTLLVTGANRGIGLALCAEAKWRGLDVIGTCRNPGDELTALGIDVIDNVDVTSDADIERLAAMLAHRSIDILINNAGVTARESLATFDAQEALREFDINALGPLRVTRVLRERLRAGAKVVILGSRAGALSAVTSGGRYAYRMSKAAAHMAGAVLAHDLRDRGIGVYILYPGYVATRMMNFEGIATCVSAREILDRIDALTLEQSGQFLHVHGEALSW